MYTINDLHYNKKRVIQISPKLKLETLALTWKMITEELKNSSPLERNMLYFFETNVNPVLAYRDNDVNQGKTGPRRRHVIGKLKSPANIDGLFIRLGIWAPGENALIPALQVLYLQKRLAEMPKDNFVPESWIYDFTDRYQSRIEEINVHSVEGIKSLGIIPAINKSLMTGNNFYFNWNSKD